jgi:hypothetical protein
VPALFEESIRPNAISLISDGNSFTAGMAVDFGVDPEITNRPVCSTFESASIPFYEDGSGAETL